MTLKTLALALFASIAAVYPTGSAFAAGAPGINPYNAILWGSYSFSFGAILTPNGYLSGVGVVTADGKGKLKAGVETTNDAETVCLGTMSGTYSINPDDTGKVNLSLKPNTPSKSCPSVNFTEAISVGQHGDVVKAMNTGKGIVTLQEDWIRQ